MPIVVESPPFPAPLLSFVRKDRGIPCGIDLLDPDGHSLEGIPQRTHSGEDPKAAFREVGIMATPIERDSIAHQRKPPAGAGGCKPSWLRPIQPLPSPRRRGCRYFRDELLRIGIAHRTAQQDLRCRDRLAVVSPVAVEVRLNHRALGANAAEQAYAA